MNYQMKVNPAAVIGTPNPKMWGIFYEEINHAGDGGIYAEMIRNRTFADVCLPEDTVYANGKVHTKRGHIEEFSVSDPLPGWSLRLSCGAVASIARTDEEPRNPECPWQLALTVTKPAGGVRVVNAGYWGMALRKIAYRGFMILKGDGITRVTVGFMYKSGDVAVSCELPVTDNFAKVPFTLDSAAEDGDVRFFVQANEAGTLYLDFVSVFPGDAAGVFRRDVFEFLHAMKPGFLRFPGGCVVEGINLMNAIHWKKTVGPIEDRPGHWDLWSYRATDGMGMKEFCDLGEMLGADLMYVCNCGMSCQARKSQPGTEDEIEWWLRNALDGIEYIAGGADTEYGAMRARDGHPEPYNLKYVEIGNENWGDLYFERYRKFYTVLKEKYPDLVLIANCAVPDQPMDMVDDHYYTRPQTFPGMYESYEGEGTPVYVGEYACNSEVGYGNLLSAVSEACFMVRMENRCGRVRIASFAPLFCNEKDRTWPVNLINYNNRRVYGIPSYYVQKCFAENAVSQVYAVEGENKNPSALHITAGQGANGLVVKIAHFDPAAESVTLDVGAAANGKAEVILLAGETPEDTNTAEAPENVRPTVSEAAAKDGKLTVELPGYCFVTVLF